jgi:transposase InsO family protein
MKSTAIALIKALTLNPDHPHTITIDGGKKFVGTDFQQARLDNNISNHLTHTYTPQENEKIERW